MRLRLIMMRHAKAEDASSVAKLADHGRALTPAGLDDAKRISGQLDTLGWQPSLVVGSDARRVAETIKMLRFSRPPTIIAAASFYLAGLVAIQKELTFTRVLPHRTIMVIGHNPGWSVAAEKLTGQSVSLKTAAAALLEVEADNWNEALMLLGDWSLVKLLTP